jgi:hypothetical protein
MDMLERTSTIAAPAAVGAGSLPLKYPAPYRAMLAICSDLDETPDAETYFELMRFLNTTEQTSLGAGVGLEVGNTIYFDMPPGHFSYWSTDDKSREKIRALIQSGHIDCLHSFGDLATTRARAACALEELHRHDCFLKVWVDHAVAPTNLGADIMRGHGDEPGHLAYHADLSFAYGIEYVWRGRVTSVVGQDCPVSFQGVANWSHPVASMKTLAKEAAKQVLARSGNGKYALHANNRLINDAVLRDGRPVREFLRSHPHWEGVSGGDNAVGMAEVLTTNYLDQLVASGGVCILYTHLGKYPSRGSGPAFPASTVAAFRRLAEYYRSGKICVTTTRRLLDFTSAKNRLKGAENWSRLKYPQLD